MGDIFFNALELYVNSSYNVIFFIGFAPFLGLKPTLSTNISFSLKNQFVNLGELQLKTAKFSCKNYQFLIIFTGGVACAALHRLAFQPNHTPVVFLSQYFIANFLPLSFHFSVFCRLIFLACSCSKNFHAIFPAQF